MELPLHRRCESGDVNVRWVDADRFSISGVWVCAAVDPKIRIGPKVKVMNLSDRRINVAPMMDWTDSRKMWRVNNKLAG